MSRRLTKVDGLQYDQKDEDEIPEKDRKAHVDAYPDAAEVSLQLSKTSYLPRWRKLLVCDL